MNFSRGLFKRAAPAFNQNGRKQFSSIPQTLYNNVWGKSNIAYITYIVVGCVAIEFVYGGVTTSIWESANKGKLYKSVDWSTWKAVDDDDDEDEEEEDE